MALIALVIGFVWGRYFQRKPKSDGVLEVTQDAKSIFTFDPTIEPEELAQRDWINIQVVRKGPDVS